MLAEVVWWRDNTYRVPWLPLAGDGSRYDRMMEKIDPSAPKTKDEVQRVRSENQKEHIAPYRPSIALIRNCQNCSRPQSWIEIKVL